VTFTELAASPLGPVLAYASVAAMVLLGVALLLDRYVVRCSTGRAPAPATIIDNEWEMV
jgi:hypothetical protein